MAKEGTETEKRIGLGHLDDETLAGLVENERDDDGKLTSTGERAFEELCRRDPNCQH